MKKLLIFVLALVSSGWAQKGVNGALTASASSCTSNGPSCTHLVLTDPSTGTAGIDLSGTFVGTASFEASFDGKSLDDSTKTWRAISVTPVASTTTVTSATAGGAWRVAVSGMTDIRVRCSAYTSGTIVVAIKSAQQAAGLGGGGGSGAVVAGTANQIAYYPASTASVSGDSRLTDDGTTLDYSGTGGITTSSTTNPKFLCGAGSTSLTVPCYLELDAGDAAANAECGYIKFFTSPGNTLPTYLCATSEGRLARYTSVPAFDATGTNRNIMMELADFQHQTGVAFADSGAVNAYVITPNPAAGSYALYDHYCFTTANPNTAASTIAVSGLGLKNLFKYGAAVTSGDIPANYPVCFTYDGTQFDMDSLPGVNTRLNQISAALATATLANGNSPILWNWAQTTNTQSGLTFGETSAATAGTVTNALANQSVLLVQTLGASTSTPLDVKQGTITGTTPFPLAQFRGIWSNSSLTGMGLVLNITDTNSAAASLLMDLRVGNADKFSVDKTGKPATVVGVATAGAGVSTVRAAARSTAQTAAVGSVATFTPAADASFLVSANVLVTTATTHAFTVTCAYTDEGNTARTLTMTFGLVAGGVTTTSIANGNGAVPYMGVPVQIRAKAATAITIATTGTFTTVIYNVEGVIQQVN